jgi:hypothetical protein
VIWPSVADERAASLRARGVKNVPAPAWKSNGIVMSAVFFVLTLVGVGALTLLFASLRLPEHVPVAIFCIAIAELLIQRRRFFGTGIESALWAGALVSLILALPSSGKVEAILVFALAAAIAGLRMRNAFFGTLAAILVVVYAAQKWHGAAPPIIAGIALGLVAAFALARQWRRESTEELFAAMAIALPAAGYIASLTEIFAKSRWWIVVLFVIGGAAMMAAAIRLRHRAMLIAASVAIAITAVEARDVIDTSREVKQIIAGLLLIVIARAIAHALRDRTSGFVITPSSMTKYDEAIQLVGAVSIPHHQAPADTGGPKIESGHGSSFGGAGTGGDY